MRTLKKVLALSLVFAMAFTMMAGAAFKDQDKIDSSLTNDIQLLTALGVFQGDENGNFNPTDNVRRSEAAKMIYVLKNNGVDDGAVAFQGVSKYSDVPVGHWAEGYINYCTNLGYMGGWQENGVQKFDPNGNVTGVELMKMLLCMIGYKADIQGYTGNGWQTNVLVDAATSGLSTNFIPSVYGATPRQWTARLMTNAIDANWVAYSKGELTYQGNTYGQQFLKLETVEGTLIETNHNKLATANGDEGKLNAVLNDVDTVTVDPVDTSAQNVVVVGEADPALLGQPVKMYYKDGGDLNEDKLYAVLPYSKTQVVINTTVDAVTVKANGSKWDVTVEGLGKKTYDPSSDSFSVYVGNVLVQDSVAGINKYLGNNVNDQVTLIVDKTDGKIDSIRLHTMMMFAEVNKLDADKGVFSLQNVSAWKAADNMMLKNENDADIVFNSSNKDNFSKYLNVASDVKEGSIVKIVLDITSGKPVYNVTLADKVEGTPSGYTLDSTGNAYGTLTINGTDYKLSDGNNAMNSYTWGLGIVNKHDTFYTDGKYVVYSTGNKAGATVDNLAYVYDSVKTTADDWGNSHYEVKVILSDGTVGTYVLDSAYDELGVKIANANTVAKDADLNTYSSVTGKDLSDATRYASTGGDDALKAMFDKTGTPKAKDKIFTYSLKDDGKIVLKAILEENGVDTNGKATYVKNTAGIAFDQKTDIATINGVQYRTNDSSYFFVLNSDRSKSTVVKASEVKQDVAASSSVKNMFVGQKINGFNTLLVGVLDMSDVKTAEAMDYYFVTGNAVNKGVVDGKYVVELPVNAAGEDTTLTFKYDAEATADLAMKDLNVLKGKLVKVDTMNSDGSVNTNKGTTQGLVKINPTSGVNADSIGWYKDDLATWNASDKIASIGGKIVSIADDVKIFNVDVADDDSSAKLVEGDTVVKSDSSNEESVAVYINADKEIEVIFVEVDGMDISFIGQ